MKIILLLYLLAAQITSVYAQNLPMPQYSSAAVVLMDAETGLVLYENEAHTQMYPASITKVMTALVVLELTNDLNERITFCDESVFGIPRLSTNIAMDTGETLSIYEALNAIMIRSANEVALALAIHIAGSEEEFADLMNRRARSLGAYNTNFVNSTGLPARGHVTTAYDMALIKREAVRHPVFAQIISTRRFEIPPTERQPESRFFINTHRQIHPGAYYNEHVVGGKTGWTTPAGNTLVTYANNGDRRLITTVLQADGVAAFHDTSSLLDFGFNLPMEYVTVFDAENYTIFIPVYQEIGGNLTEISQISLSADYNLQFYLPPDWNSSWLRYELSVPESLSPPISIGDPLGRVAVYIQNIRIAELPLLAREAAFAYAPTFSEPTPAYFPSIREYYSPPAPTPQFSGILSPLNNEYILTLFIPIGISLITLAIALVVTLTRKRRRLRKILRGRRSYYSSFPHYRYRE
jgi:D-alanyl-D-alanine carboxypeptidase (penicillin-binding protein 5/6)